MDKILQPEEVIAGYEDSLPSLSSTDLLQLPYQLKSEGNRYMSSQSFTEAAQSYIKALMTFQYLLNHSLIKVQEQVIQYVENIEVSLFVLS